MVNNVLLPKCWVQSSLPALLSWQSDHADNFRINQSHNLPCLDSKYYQALCPYHVSSRCISYQDSVDVYSISRLGRNRNRTSVTEDCNQNQLPVYSRRGSPVTDATDAVQQKLRSLMGEPSVLWMFADTF